MEIVKGMRYRIKSNSQIREYLWWVKPETSERVKTLHVSMLPLSMAGEFTVRPDHKLDIAALEQAISSENENFRLDTISGFSGDIPEPYAVTHAPDNFDYTGDEILDINWLKSNGFVKSGKRHLSVSTPITIELVEG